jgi:hypothetical protein
MKRQSTVVAFFGGFVRVCLEALEELAVVCHGARAAGAKVVKFRSYHDKARGAAMRCCGGRRGVGRLDS